MPAHLWPPTFRSLSLHMFQPSIAPSCYVDPDADPDSDRIMKEVPTYRVISQSTLIDRMKVTGSLARKAIAHLEKEGLIKRVVHHHAQLIYTRASKE